MRFIASVAMGIAMAASAHAADFGGSKDYGYGPSWGGVYVGGVLGGGFGTSRKDFIQGTTTGDFTVDGVVGGGTIGYSAQWGRLVAGLEADFSASSVGGKTDCPNAAFYCETSTSWLATMRPRIGYAFGNVLPYVTSGLATGDVNVHSYLKAPPGGGGVDETKTAVGWTVGGGVEALASSNWSVKVEYLYVQYPTTDALSNVGTPTSTKFDESVVRLGINYFLK